MSASVFPSRTSAPLATPGRFTAGTTAPDTMWNCSSPAASHAAASSGASVPAKSTVPALIWLMPAEEPTDW